MTTISRRPMLLLCTTILSSFFIGFYNNPSNAGKTLALAGNCPQPRFTDKAPANIYRLTNPLRNTKESIAAGKKLYLKLAKPIPCWNCHGRKGNGKGPLALNFDPAPRNFSCAKTVNNIPDGQLFWIIQNGSPGTGMVDFKTLSKEQIWQLVLYLRALANHKS